MHIVSNDDGDLELGQDLILLHVFNEEFKVLLLGRVPGKSL
jgi:hypothetical protein